MPGCQVRGSKCQMSVKMAAAMEVGDLGFLCDRKPCSKSTFKLFEQLFDTRYLFFRILKVLDLQNIAQLKRKRKLIMGAEFVTFDYIQ